MRITHKYGSKKEPAVTFRRWQAMEALYRAQAEAGEDAVSERAWRTAFNELTDATGDNKRKAFVRSVDALVAAGYVSQEGMFSFRLVRDKWER